MQNEDLGAIFSSKYESGASDWGGHSGGGSHPYYTMAYRAFIEQFIELNDIRTVKDVGCGDWQFSKFINYDNVDYTGYDVVAEIIKKNNNKYSSLNKKFELMPDDLNEFEGADLLLVKDVFQHLSDDQINEFKLQVIPKFKFCLITNSYRKVNSSKNINIKPGQFRCLDLNSPPYSFDGVYVLEFASPLWEMIRVLLVRP